MMQRIFITHILPESFIVKYRLSTAACNFSYNLMSGGGFDITYSILGTYIGGRLDSKIFLDNRFILYYNNFFRNKGRIGIQIASIIEQWQIFRKIPLKASVWLYNVTTLNAILYLLLKVFKRSVKINVIQLDFTPVESGFGLNQFFLKMYNNCHGNIRLSESALFTNKNSITLPGVVPLDIGEFPKIESVNNRFLLSGVLNEQISQVTIVMKVFSQLPDCELHITGKADKEWLIREYAEKYSNIYWHGNLTYENYLNIMHSCAFQLSTRNPKFPENQCNFPSKIIEALYHNRIIISTIKYKQIESVNYFKVNSDELGLKENIKYIYQLSQSVLLKYANQRSKIEKLCNVQVWNNAMSKIEEYGQ